MGDVVEFEVFRDYLGVGATEPEVDDVSKLFDAINAEIRRLTHRAFEGDAGGSYDQVIRIDGSQEFRLPWTPVETVTSIARHWFDGTEDDPYDAAAWRLEDRAGGLVALRPASSWQRWPMRRGQGPEYVRVIWTTTGEIPAQVPQAALEWGRDRWSHRDQDGALSGYTTGQDAETYFAALAGKPPRGVLVALMGVKHLVGGGKV